MISVITRGPDLWKEEDRSGGEKEEEVWELGGKGQSCLKVHSIEYAETKMIFRQNYDN